MEEDINITVENNTPKCPECDSELVVVGHCATCYTCGFSLCSL